MPKFNTGAARPVGRGPISVEDTTTVLTHEGAPAYRRDPKSDLFLLGVTNMVGETTFYETSDERDSRYAQLVRTVALEDPAWLRGFLTWLRADANMRSAPLVGAAEAVKARLEAGITDHEVTNRSLISAVLQRADEPGELLAYWTGRFGRAIPKPVKRGVADAVLRLGTEFNYAKWDSDGRGYRFADVLSLCHPGDRKGSAQRFREETQRDLFGHIIDTMHQSKTPPESLGLLTRRAALMSMDVAERRQVLEDPETLRRAGITWEALAGWLQGPMDAAAWEAIIPSMGYMALLRNLRNFDQAGVSDRVAEQVCARLSDPEQVAKSRQFPFRFLSAYDAAPSLRWGHALEKALQHSLTNLPTFGGRTLVLVDTSASMTSTALSARSTITPLKAAAVFGVALAAKGEQVDLVGFADGVFDHPIGPGASVLREINRFTARVGEVGHGTQLHNALYTSIRRRPCDRVIVISDMQTMDSEGRLFDPGWGGSRDNPTRIHPSTPVYAFNTSGYAPSIAGGDGIRVELGGLSDATFRMIPLIEAGHAASWPFPVD
jgi:hypothetical protein